MQLETEALCNAAPSERSPERSNQRNGDRDRGFEASSSEEALDILANGPLVDMLLTDHLMPGMSSGALAYEVRKRWPLIRTVVISGYAEDDGVAPDLLRLNKPFRQSELAKDLATALAVCRDAGANGEAKSNADQGHV